MKKILMLSLLAVTGTFLAKAQTQKGSQLLGGYLGVSTGSNTTDYNNSPYSQNNSAKTTSFSIGPSYSYFIADNLDLGGSIGYSYQGTTYTYPMAPAFPTSSPSRFDSHSFSSTAYLRKYFLYDGKIGVRAGPYAQYSYMKSNSDYVDPTNNTVYHEHTINAGIGLDLVYFPTKRLGLSSSIGSLAYSNVTSDQTFSEHIKSNSLSLSLSSALNLGIFYSFGK